MASKFSKRSTHPKAVNSWLDSLGYYRKTVAYDETCLFRVIAEQMFDSQLYHERVRKEVIAYGKKHSKEFKEQVPKKWERYETLKKLSFQILICSDEGIQLICETYDVDITMFNAEYRSVEEFKCHALDKGYRHLLICKLNYIHFDTVYNKEYIANAGFCQSIVYKLLYEEVFDIPDVTSIVNGMLHDKQASYSLNLSEGSSVKTEYSDNGEGETSDEIMLQPSIVVQQNALAPFPFKVAEALDPNMYRNIEYDTWAEVRLALFLPSAKVKVSSGSDYPIETGEEWNLSNATGSESISVSWRPTSTSQQVGSGFDNSIMTPPTSSSVGYRENYNAVSDGDSLDNNNSQAKPRDANANVPDLNIINYEGCALSMQEAMNAVSVDNMNAKFKVSSGSDYPIETGEEWNLSNATGSESISVSWRPTSTSQQVGSGFDNSIMTPPTSSSVGYRESNNNVPLYYNCSPEYAYSSVPIWSQPRYRVSPDPGISLSDNDNSTPLDSSRNSQNYVYYQPESAYESPAFLSPSLPAPPPTFTPYTFSYNDNICSTPVTPVSPHMDVYPFMYPVPPPGTPKIYSHPPPPTAPLMAPLGSPMPLYNTPNELQCVNSPTYMYPPQTPPTYMYPPQTSPTYVYPPQTPPTYMYPPQTPPTYMYPPQTPPTYMYPPQTPPVTWYPPPSINAQSFIFPPPLNPPTNVPM